MAKLVNNNYYNNDTNNKTKNILVLCQRKYSTEHNYVSKFTNLIHVKMSEFFETNNLNIEYLGTNRDQTGKFDYNFNFNINNQETKEFVENHQKYYDAVLFFTCPMLLILLDDPETMKSIYKILKSNGIVFIKGDSFNPFTPHPIDNRTYFNKNGFKYNNSQNLYYKYNSNKKSRKGNNKSRNKK